LENKKPTAEAVGVVLIFSIAVSSRIVFDVAWFLTCWQLAPTVVALCSPNSVESID
jgi:hypothetical protein